jgi:phage head maturation protease
MNNERTELKDFTVNVTADIESRTCISKISTSCVDEEGEVVLPSGIQTTRFTKGGGTAFWNHDYGDPVASTRWLELTDDGMVASSYFPPRPDEHVGEWRPDTVLSLVASGLCNGVSIGFSYIETREPTAKDKSRFKTTGNELQRVISKSRLLEYSFAPLPMNEDALVMAVSKGLIRKDGTINEDAVKACRLGSEAKIEQRSLRLDRAKALQLDPAKMTRLVIERLQGRVY